MISAVQHELNALGNGAKLANYQLVANKIVEVRDVLFKQVSTIHIVIIIPLYILLIYQHIIKQCPVLIVGVCIGIMGWPTVDAAGEDEGTGGTTVLTEEREITAHNVFCTLLIVLNACSLGIVVIGGSGDTAPIMDSVGTYFYFVA